jgi:hypothetical protein
MFEICVISPPRRSSVLKCDTLFEAEDKAREAALMTGCNGRTGDVVKRYGPSLGCGSRPSGNAMGDPGRTERAARAEDLRRQAALARQAASIPTAGSSSVDRLLVVLAEQLERDALLLEQE